ncbi:MAG: prohibitin family protein [candidate division WOR-3 bacterium]|nr:MAG: prohibitin family protein [candidate division WOR-3 bacterium]
MFILGILIIIGLFVFRSVYKVRPEDVRIYDKLRTRYYVTAGSIVLAVILILASLIRIVPPGSVGVQVLFGRVLTKATLSEGLNIVNPFVNLEIMTIRTQAYTMSIATEEGQRYGDDAIVSLTKDGLEVKMDLTVWYHLLASEAANVFQKIGRDYVDKIVRPAARTAIRNTTVRYMAVEIYSEKREEVQTEISKSLEKDYGERGIALEKVLLRNISLPDKVKNAIEAKLEAEQEAQKMEFVLLKETKEADRKKIEAAGIAEAQRIIAQSLIGERGRAYLSWKYLENLRSLYQSPNNTIVISPFDKAFIPLLQVK